MTDEVPKEVSEYFRELAKRPRSKRARARMSIGQKRRWAKYHEKKERESKKDA